jgi:RimJ/RimL family protein N-acetyltransferase
MEIIDYEQKKMSKQIKELFSKIYPNQPELVKRMDYDENLKNHIATKVALIGDEIIGQANIFRLIDDNTGNLGYHVSPDYQNKGIGEKISKEAIAEAKKKGIKLLIVRTETNNISSIKLAKKLGFAHPSKEFINKNIKSLQSKDHQKIVILVKNIK